MLRSFLKLVQSPRRIDRRSLLGSAMYALEAVICVSIVVWVYRYFHLGSAMWAVVSSVLVLQPGLEQSYGASATRFVANLVGAFTGGIIDKLHGHGVADVMVALVIVVGLCEIMRLDQGLRSACASTIIVMMSAGGAVAAHATERRVLAVLIGCSVALLIRIAAEKLRRSTKFGAPAPGGEAQVDEG